MAAEKQSTGGAHLIILLGLACCIGIYLIATTVLIAQDGVFYIERARRFSSRPIQIIKGHPFGYPFLIFAVHKLIALLRPDSALAGWIFSAQFATLLCRLLALIPLYFIGRLLLGPRESFWAVLILIVLPYPAQLASDALRDWPHILFLALGFVLLLWGIRRYKWWAFGAAGIVAGFGHLIRPECAQLVVYGSLWLLVNLFRPQRKAGRARLFLALVALVIGFAVPAGPYMRVRGRVLPKKLKAVISCSSPFQSDQTEQTRTVSCDTVKYPAGALPVNVVRALGELVRRISETLMHFFVPPLLIGIYYHFRRRAGSDEKFLITTFVILNIVTLVLLHCHYGYISRRHSLPLVVFTIFYVPVGLQIIAGRLNEQLSKSGREMKTAENRHRIYFFALVIVGVAICAPKLLRPMRADKRNYRAAAKWLQNNSAPSDVIAAADGRISFYAGRKVRQIVGDKIPRNANYVIQKFKSEDEMPAYEETLPEKFSLMSDWRDGKNIIGIYGTAR